MENTVNQLINCLQIVKKMFTTTNKFSYTARQIKRSDRISAHICKSLSQQHPRSVEILPSAENEIVIGNMTPGYVEIQYMI